MSSSKPSGQATTVVSNDPWSGQQPYLQAGFKDAEVLKNQPQSYYPNSTVVPFHGATTDALSGMESRARSGSDLLRTGQAQTQATASGAYESPSAAGFGMFGAGTGGGQSHLSNVAGGSMLGSNPYLDNVVKQAQDTAGAGIDARFSGSGRYGSGHHAKAVADTGANIASQIYGQEYGAERGRQDAAAGQLAQTQLSGLQGGANAYNAERGRMLTAAQMSPQMAQADYSDLAQLGQVGAAYEGQGQAELQDQISRYQFEQQAPRDALREYMATIGGGSYGNQQTSSQPIYSNPFGEGLGMAGTAAGIAGSLWGQGGVWGS